MAEQTFRAPKPERWGALLALAAGLVLAGSVALLAAVALGGTWVYYPATRLLSLSPQACCSWRAPALSVTTRFVTVDPIDKVVDWFGGPQHACAARDISGFTCNQVQINLGRVTILRATSVNAGPYNSTFIDQQLKVAYKP